MESNQIFGIGQEVISGDLNKIPSRMERGFYDYVVRQILGNKTNAFFQDSLKLTYLTAYSAQVKAGLGFQSLDSGIDQPVQKPVYLATDTTINFDGADSSNNRIDIVCVKAELVDGDTVSRNYKEAGSDVISQRDFVSFKKWVADIIIVSGTPAASPVAPATPANYIKINEVLINTSVGMTGQGDITDVREKMPFCTSTTTTGANEYDAIVGSIPQANYSSLKQALDNASDGWKILVLEDETIDSGAIPSINNNNIEVVFKNGVTFTKGSAGFGLIVNADYCIVRMARFKDFASAGNFGIQVAAAKKYNNIDSPRFNNCDGSIDDNGDNTINNVTIFE